MKLNNKGMTLVEMILSILILGIISLSFAECFASLARITNRATLYRNASSAASSSIELEEKVESKDPRVDVDFDYTAQSNVVFKIKGVADPISIKGSYAVGKYEGNGDGTKLTYHEFMPSNYSYTLPVVDSNQGS